MEVGKLLFYWFKRYIVVFSYYGIIKWLLNNIDDYYSFWVFCIKMYLDICILVSWVFFISRVNLWNFWKIFINLYCIIIFFRGFFKELLDLVDMYMYFCFKYIGWNFLI